MLVFFIITTIIILLLPFYTKIGIHIDNLRIVDSKKIEGNLWLLVSIFNKTILKIKMDNDKMSKLVNKEKISIGNMNFSKIWDSVKYLLSNKTKIKNISLNICIGTGDVLITTYAVTIISTILSCILPIYIEGKLKDSNYKVEPIYENKLTYEVELDSIIQIKTVHIIHTIYLNLKKRRDEKYDRTSNREPYASSYE